MITAEHGRAAHASAGDDDAAAIKWSSEAVMQVCTEPGASLQEAAKMVSIASQGSGGEECAAEAPE